MNVLERAREHFENRARGSVEVPEWGVTVYFKAPNLVTMDKIGTESKGGPHERAARLVAACATDEAGNRMFKTLDYKELMIAADAGVVARISAAIMELVKVDPDEAAKNSSATHTD